MDIKHWSKFRQIISELLKKIINKNNWSWSTLLYHSDLPFSENLVYSGDHIPWHIPLDGSESRIQHMLMSEDAQLSPITTPFGSVNFVQVNKHYTLIEIDKFLSSW